MTRMLACHTGAKVAVLHGSDTCMAVIKDQLGHLIHVVGVSVYSLFSNAIVEEEKWLRFTCNSHTAAKVELI